MIIYSLAAGESTVPTSLPSAWSVTGSTLSSCSLQTFRLTSSACVKYTLYKDLDECLFLDINISNCESHSHIIYMLYSTLSKTIVLPLNYEGITVLVAGEGFEPSTSRLWAWWAASALPRKFLLVRISGLEPEVAWTGIKNVIHYTISAYIVAGEGFEPPTFRLWAWWAAAALSHYYFIDNQHKLYMWQSNFFQTFSKI